MRGGLALNFFFSQAVLYAASQLTEHQKQACPLVLLIGLHVGFKSGFEKWTTEIFYGLGSSKQ